MSDVQNSNRTALVVEDEWLVRMELADALQDAGWQVLEAGTAEQALKFFEAGEVIDLLVTDIRLPGLMTGWDLAEQLRARRPVLPVVYASANPAVESRFVEGSVFVEKPCRINILLQICEKLHRSARQF